MNPPNSGNNKLHRRRRRFSWAYDEDHHIGQYYNENSLLPINENHYQSEDDQENSYYEYSHNNKNNNGNYDEHDDDDDDDDDGDDCETDHGSGMDQNLEQEPSQKSSHPLHQNSGNGMVRRRRSLRKVLGKGWEIPSEAVMQRRNRFRKNVDVETKRHRRIIPRSNKSNDTNGEAKSKNVLHLLWDRELFGGGSSNGGIRSSVTTSRGMGSNTSASEFTVGVPLTTATIDSEDDSSTKDKKRRRRKKRQWNLNNANTTTQQPSPEGGETTITSTTTTTTTTNAATATATNIKNGSVLGSYSHRHTTDELRTYAEQACVTKFESSYLSHLQHEIVEDSKAVSTISIAFAPDGKTMASTHGDHTVKITCCVTGKLLQTLVGHPRTPWTVKYHPHAGADLKNPETKKEIIANRTAITNNILNNNNNSSSTNIPSQEEQHQQQHYQQQQQQIVASGCLGHQVRIWDWVSGTCLQMIRLDFAIISLSFHPAGNVLAIANGTRLHFWSLPTVTQADGEIQTNATTANSGIPEGESSTVAGNNSSTTNTNVSQPRRGMHIEMRHMLRCVHFLPDGKRVIVGGVNPQTRAEIQRQRRLAAEGNQEKVPVMSFYLRLWDFDLEAARGPPTPRNVEARQGNSGLSATQGGAPENAASAEGGTSSRQSNSNSNISRSSNITSGSTPLQQQAMFANTQAAAAAVAATAALGTTTRRRRAISNPRCFVPRALLYNDGGFDVSPDGKTLCACAEYWLPEGVDNATDLLHPLEKDADENDFDYDSSSDDSNSDEETGSCDGDKDDIDVTMNDVSGEEAVKKNHSRKESSSKIGKNDSIAADSSGSAVLADAKEDITPADNTTQEVKREVSNSSPTRPLASSASRPSATPPHILGRQPQQIASPPLAVGVISSSSGSGAYGVPMPPMQAGITPQTPPPNVNPITFPLSPPSPPGRRFAGGLSRGTQPPSQQHEQLLQHYNRQQAMLNQQRLNQQQQTMPAIQQQQGGSVSTPPSRGTETTATSIPAPPRINHRNNRQHRLDAQPTGGGGIQKAGNPFGTTSRNTRGSANPNTQRGRFVPHVVTISLDTEPYVETTTEEVVVGFVGSNIASGDAVSGDAATATGRIRSTTVATTSNKPGSSNTTIVTKTTYNIPGRGAAFGATRPHVLERRPRLGQLLSACPLDGAKASAVTCVKFSPCIDFCLIGYGVREPHVEESNGESNDPPAHPPYHPVTAMYKVNKGGKMRHVSTMLSGDDDVNISRFHPDSGYGFVYGTKQGRIRILGPRPWNYYNC